MGGVKEGREKKEDCLASWKHFKHPPRYTAQQSTEQKNLFASAKIKAVKPDGGACQNVIRDEVIAISSSLAMEASNKL